MDTQLPTKRSVALIAVLAVASVSFLAIGIKAADDKKHAAKSDAAAVDFKDKGEPLFNGTDLTGWRFADPGKAKIWSVVPVQLDPADKNKLAAVAETAAKPAGAMLRAHGDGTDIFTEKAFGDVQLHIEFMIPDGSNSGVYLMGQYEVQILSNFGKPDNKLGPGDCGGIYTIKAPDANPLKPYGEWNSYDIVFHAPRFDAAGKKTENARFVQVAFNGKVIHENVEAPHPTGGQLPGGEKAKGPLMLQGNHGSVAFRNIRITELEAK
ncbi:MAG: hypothetical protein JWO87_622 [Phycisphaerales bacterium]|jgi:hypothetical protein|nr:hypothetical protein [Phycisphaerales bacterium]